ncbi:kinase-like protein [Neolentinus lepideus HHB14362 ss-1]|uniref:Kinase-like protein n=1 Tax=Neolentinus lepideus HHB14362 ss-1 TaxID=1314782 RepID=A0A165SDM4_9AGAM|nr:kinase-like protein [Neolentinus lepideus HHB14362 ss-1]
MIWSELNHPNILPLYGIVDDFGGSTATLTSWKENGTLSSYLERSECSLQVNDRFSLVSPLDPVIATSRLTASSNILVDEAGKALISGFGFRSVSRYDDTATEIPLPAPRWAAPEIYIHDSKGQAAEFNTACDVYAFGSVTYQILSGRIPYHDLKTDVQVVLALLDYRKPTHPTDGIDHIPDEYRMLLQECWANDPEERPSINQIEARIEAFQCDALDTTEAKAR